MTQDSVSGLVVQEIDARLQTQWEASETDTATVEYRQTAYDTASGCRSPEKNLVGHIHENEDDEELIDHGGYTEDPRLLDRRKAWFEAYCAQFKCGPSDLPLRCPCCYHKTLDDRSQYEICRICWWEDDGQDDHNADLVLGGPNASFSLTEARAMFRQNAAQYPDDRTMLSLECLRAFNPEAEPMDGGNILLDDANEANKLPDMRKKNHIR